MRHISKLCIRTVANAAHAASSSARAREERGRARGGAARAMRRGRVCQARRGGGVAAQPARPRAVQRALGTSRRLGRARRRKQQRRRGRGRPREAHAAAHPIRIVPVDVPSKADQPRELRLLAVLCGLEHGLAHRGLGTAGTHLFSALVASSAVAARESRPTSFPDTQSEKKSGSRGPKGAKHEKLHEGASTGTGRAPELAARASAHARRGPALTRACHEVTVTYLSRPSART